ncbi:flagellar export chaperone FliS [Paenibacillus sp. An7]|uniref:flagellar export chaperone FliS n=1 Tax=Paenibacillus sp. An7 TaxID=2689577 RepID=UPI00135A6543|nr:flagellar export chaperone FliS [Paenibacillus sp. An7]
MLANPYEKYRQSSVQTSNPAQLVIMLYDGAIRFIRASVEGLEDTDFEKANLNLGKAQTIISELMVTLDRKYEVSNGLYSLYEYMNYLLIQANIKKSQEPAQEAMNMLIDLRDTWLSASKLAVTKATHEAAN